MNQITYTATLENKVYRASAEISRLAIEELFDSISADLGIDSFCLMLKGNTIQRVDIPGIIGTFTRTQASRTQASETLEGTQASETLAVGTKVTVIRSSWKGTTGVISGTKGKALSVRVGCFCGEPVFMYLPASDLEPLHSRV